MCLLAPLLNMRREIQLSDHGDHPITRDHPISPHSSASSLPPCFKGFGLSDHLISGISVHQRSGFAFPITAITQSRSYPC